MKLVIVSDTHQDHDVEIPDGDILIHLGDYVLGWEGMFTSQLSKAKNWLLSHKSRFKHIICVIGNHDPIDSPEILRHDDIIVLHDNMIIIDDITFFGTPWSTPCYGNFNATEEEIGKRLLPYADRNIDVILSHSPPYKILDKSSRGFHTGSKALRDFVFARKPKYHIFGHCHNTSEQSTTVKGIQFINASCHKHGNATVVDL